MFPTRGLVSIAGIAPLDWLLDNTGPIARTVTDAAITLGVMAGEDALDSRTLGSAKNAQGGPYIKYLKPDALKGSGWACPHSSSKAQEYRSRAFRRCEPHRK